uniref:Ionotropic receptor n=1 Tax=Eogystia hippophaecolus TaxID=1206364 RepID=A0A1B3P5G1_EOGHI|nr:ionotropic receptor [Eogystia hippophaecolus]
MLTLQPNVFHIELLLHTILNQYLYNSYCVTFVSEIPLDINFSITFTCIVPDPENLTNQLLEVSEKGCSDYVVRMKEPQEFMNAYEKVNHLGNARRSDKKLIFLPFLEDDNTTNETISPLLNLLSMKETSFVANILLLIPSRETTAECKFYDIVTHKYVGPDKETNHPLYLDRWNSCTEKFVMNVNLFPHDMSNLYGKTVKVACFTYKPYVLLDLDTPTGRDGMELRIVEEFCRWVNCTMEVVRNDAHEWGEIYDNQTGVGVLGNVLEDRADLGITALYSWYEEYVVLDFSAPCIRTAVTCVAPAPRLLASWELPLMPFTWHMWIALIFTFLFSSVALIVVKGFSSKNVFITTFGMMVTQCQPEVRADWRVRSITGWLLITGLVFDNAYSGGLASTFTVPKYETSIDTVQDIVDRKMEWGATHDAWTFSITLSTEPLIKQLVSQFKIYSAEELKRKSFTRNMAFSIEKLPAGYFAVGEYITKEAMLDLEIMLEDFYYEQCVVMLRKSSPYTSKISDLVGRLHESGLMLAWETQVALKYLNYKVQLEVKLSRSRRDVDNIEPLSFRQVVGIFIIYLIGVSLSIVIFVAEMCINDKNKKKLNQ